MHNIDQMLDTAIKEKRRLTPEEVQRLLKDPDVQDALKDPVARFAFVAVSKLDKAKRKVCSMACKAGKRGDGIG
jgi:hypothetical protein